MRPTITAIGIAKEGTRHDHRTDPRHRTPRPARRRRRARGFPAAPRRGRRLRRDERSHGARAGPAPAGPARGLQRGDRRPEHDPDLPDDGALPAGDAGDHPRRLRQRRHLLRLGRGLRSLRGRAHPRRGRGAVPRSSGDRHQVRLEHRPGDLASGCPASTASPTT